MYATVTKKHPNSLTIVPETREEKNEFMRLKSNFERWEKELNLYLEGKASYPSYDFI